MFSTWEATRELRVRNPAKKVARYSDQDLVHLLKINHIVHVIDDFAFAESRHPIIPISGYPQRPCFKDTRRSLVFLQSAEAPLVHRPYQQFKLFPCGVNSDGEYEPLENMAICLCGNKGFSVQLYTSMCARAGLGLPMTIKNSRIYLLENRKRLIGDKRAVENKRC